MANRLLLVCLDDTFEHEGDLVQLWIYELKEKGSEPVQSQFLVRLDEATGMVLKAQDGPLVRWTLSFQDESAAAYKRWLLPVPVFADSPLPGTYYAEHVDAWFVFGATVPIRAPKVAGVRLASEPVKRRRKKASASQAHVGT